MTTFDGWEAQLYGPDTLAHFRTKGSKNGVRRYQNEDGTWTPLGLKERKAREGWGERRRTARAERKSARQERRASNAAARKERIAALKEKRRANNVKTMTDDELRKRIDRLKLEQEYKDLAKFPLLKTGEKVVASILEYKNKKEQHEIDRTKQAIEMERLRVEKTKAIEGTKQAKEEAAKAKSEYKKATTESAKKQASANLVNQKTQAKRFVADYTIRGGLRKRINSLLTSGYGEKKSELRYISSLKKGSARISRFNKGRDAVNQILYKAPDRDEFNRARKNNNDNNKDKDKKNK